MTAALTGMQRSSSQLILLIVVASFGDGPAAAFALSRRAENVVNHTSRGLGRAREVLLRVRILGRVTLREQKAQYHGP